MNTTIVEGTKTTFQDFIPLFMRDHLAHLEDPRSRYSVIKLYFPPLAAFTLDSFTPHDAHRWYMEVSQTSKVQANHALTMLRVMYKKATEWGFYNGGDPTRHIKRHVRHPRSVVIEEHEMPHVMRTIFQAELYMQNALLLCLCTASRPGEVCRATWSSFQFWTERNPLTKHTHWAGRWDKGKTKNGTEQIIPLPALVAEKLRQLPHTGAWVFPGQSNHWNRKGAGPMSYSHFFNQWEDIRRVAKIPHVTLHDLRRTGCTYLLNSNENLMLVSKGIMNHSTVQTTRGYTKPFERALRGIMDRHSDRLVAYGEQVMP